MQRLSTQQTIWRPGTDCTRQSKPAQASPSPADALVVRLGQAEQCKRTSHDLQPPLYNISSFRLREEAELFNNVHFNVANKCRGHAPAPQGTFVDRLLCFKEALSYSNSKYCRMHVQL